MEITLFIRGQKLEAHYPPLYSGSVGVLYARFAEIDFDKTLVKAVRFKTADSDWYTADIADGAVRVPHEVIVSGGFDIALAGYENEDGKLARFLPTNSVHINVEENGYGDPDAPIESEGEPASYTAKIEKLTSDAAAKADAAMTELEKKANAAEVYDKDTADALLGGKVDKESNAALSTVRSVSVEESPSQASTMTVAYQNGSSKTANYCTPSLTDKLLAELKEKSVPHKTVSGCPVTLTDALAGERLRECRIYGSTAGVGDPDGGVYKIPVRVCGKNLFDSEQLLKASGWTCTDGVYSGTVSTLFKAFGIETEKGYDIPLRGKKLAISFEAKNSDKTTVTTYFQVHYTDGAKQNIGAINSTEWKKYSGVTNSGNISKIVAGYSNDDTVYFRNIQIEAASAVTGYEPYSGSSAVAEVDTPLASGEYIDLLGKKRYASDGTATDITVTGELKTIESGSITIDCTTGVQPPRIEAEYWQDINKAIAEMKKGGTENEGQ